MSSHDIASSSKPHLDNGLDEVATGDNRVSSAPPVSAERDGGGMTTLSRAEIGALGEQLAVDHLTSLGLRVLIGKIPEVSGQATVPGGACGAG